jgi:dihydroorotate dehydrogenase (fumarate)
MANRLDDAGADGLVLFNRFLQADIDCERLAAAPGVTLSTAAEVRLPLAWIALLHNRVRASLAAGTGVESGTEVVKYLLAGADVVQSASALLRHGPDYATVILDELEAWMGRKGFRSVKDFRGLLAIPDDGAMRERFDYVSALLDADVGAIQK